MPDKTMNPRKPRILLAVRDFEIRSRLQSVLRGASYEVVTCPQADDLPRLNVTAHELRCYDLAIWDVELLDEKAVRQIQDLQCHTAFPPLILVTALRKSEALIQSAYLVLLRV